MPAFLYRACPNQKTMYHPAKDEYIKTEVKIGDVCRGCNSGPLSELDARGKTFFEKNECTRSFMAGQVLRVDYDYDILLRWLLKLSYNSSRAMSSQSDVLEACAGFILGREELLHSAAVMLEVVSEPDHAGLSEADRDSLADDGASLSSWFRFGRFGISHSELSPAESRFIVLNAFHFYIALFSTDVPRKQRRDWTKCLQVGWPDVTVISSGRSAVAVRVSNRTSFDTQNREQLLSQMPAWQRHVGRK